MSENQDDLYSPNTYDLESQTLPLDEIIRQAINSALLETHVWMPSKITKIVNSSTVNLQPLFKRKYVSGDLINIPEIQNAMVCMPRGGDYSIAMPVAVGDTGIALFCDRSLDVWSYSTVTDPIDPQDSRNHDLIDAIFVPGLYPIVKPMPGNGSDLIVTNGKAKISVQKSGKFKIQNTNAELLDLLVQLLQTLLTATVQTAIGPQPFTPMTLAKLSQINILLKTLKGT